MLRQAYYLKHQSVLCRTSLEILDELLENILMTKPTGYLKVKALNSSSDLLFHLL